MLKQHFQISSNDTNKRRYKVSDVSYSAFSIDDSGPYIVRNLVIPKFDYDYEKKNHGNYRDFSKKFRYVCAHKNYEMPCTLYLGRFYSININLLIVSVGPQRTVLGPF